jgi:hypothetical protein
MTPSLQLCILAVTLALALSGCAAETEFTLDPQTHQVIGKRTYRSHEEAWRDLVERRIQAEIAGEAPDVRGETWPQFWRGWYSSLRHNKDGEERIAYIRAKRKEHGLNPY